MCLHKTILRKGERNEMQKMAFNNFTGHCQLNTDMVILHWTMIIQPEAISQKQKKKRIMHLEKAEEFLLSQDSRIHRYEKIAFSFCTAWVGNVMLMHKWTTICGNLYFQAHLFFIQKIKVFCIGFGKEMFGKCWELFLSNYYVFISWRWVWNILRMNKSFIL